MRRAPKRARKMPKAWPVLASALNRQLGWPRNTSTVRAADTLKQLGFIALPCSSAGHRPAPLGDDVQCSAKRSNRHSADAAFARQARTCAAWTCSCSAARPHPSLERRPPPAWLQLRARACARNLPDTPRHGGEATVTGCLCDGNSRGKQPAAGCRRTGSPIETTPRTPCQTTGRPKRRTLKDARHMSGKENNQCLPENQRTLNVACR